MYISSPSIVVIVNSAYSSTLLPIGVEKRRSLKVFRGGAIRVVKDGIGK
jgi:hypothetical protein